MHNKRPKDRPSPPESATLFEVGTKRVGGDGNIWVIKLYGKTKRWVPVKSVIDESDIKIKNDLIISFNLDTIIRKLKSKPKKIGELEITGSKIGVGELIYNDLPAKKGWYDIYTYHKSLIAVGPDTFGNDKVFELTKYYADCDIGMFAFNDTIPIRPERKGKFGKIFPGFYIDLLSPGSPNQIRNTDVYYIYETDLIMNQNTETDVDDSNPIAIFAGNGYGDGSFHIYRSGKNYLIMSEELNNKILDLMVIDH